jgi:two-component system phosphate regulon sensor histidine kinase PhoR
VSDLNGQRFPDRFWFRKEPARPMLIAAGIVLSGLVAFGALRLGYALLLLAVLAVTGFVSSRRRIAGAVPALETLDAGSSYRRLEAILEGFPDPVVATDGDGLVLAINAPALRLTPALRRGEPAAVALRMPPLVEAMRRAAASGEPQVAEYSDRGPIDRWFEAHVIPIASADVTGGHILVVTMRDLTPLRQSEAMRADFVANASHELRTPLASLSGFIETLQGPARDDAPARERFLDIMKGQATRMGRLIDDLLSLSRIERNLHIPPETQVDLALVVRQVVDALQMLARERKVEVIVEGPDDPMIVQGDRDELYRVFENLVENALKYGATGQRMDINMRRESVSGAQPEAVVTVRDYGPGIAPEHLPRLTERFYRIDVGQSRAEGGTGLGLALVKHILNRHRGRLSIESTLNAGATFAVHLPLIPQGGPVAA